MPAYIEQNLFFTKKALKCDEQIPVAGAISRKSFSASDYSVELELNFNFISLHFV